MFLYVLRMVSLVYQKDIEVKKVKMFCIFFYKRKYLLDKFGEGEIIWSYYFLWVGLFQCENQLMMRMKIIDFMLYE